MEFLLESEVDPDPVRQFERWYREAEGKGFPLPNAMTLATTSRNGRPSARVVLLKAFDRDGFVFYTNYASRKSKDLRENPYGSLLFWWPPPLDRQVRIDGRVEAISEERSDEYFATRPRGSQLSAWASEQSRVIPDRATLDQRMAELEKKFAGKPVPRPPHWGGFRLEPEEFEFWQNQPNRLHDRLRYQRVDGQWVIERLAP